MPAVVRFKHPISSDNPERFSARLSTLNKNLITQCELNLIKLDSRTNMIAILEIMDKIKQMLS